MIGQTIAHYRITAKLGQGGMGAVYRATDTKLDRDVAIKVLPELFVQDQERLARFDREAKTLAALNHPSIAGIYGLEQTGNSKALVLELVEGEDLAVRLKRGPLPVEEGLEVCKQIAEALEAAHEKGIIHRDLKPGNIKLLADGRVKVLDFGLAKVLSEAPSTAEGNTALEDSPTVFSQGQATMPGVLLGTAGYMSPEQARGKPVDKRSDIWSFGVVLFECLTGGRLFTGETVTDSIGALLHKEIDWSQLPPSTPPTVQLLLRKCLTRDRKRRLQDIGDARVDLDQAIADPSSSIIRLSGAALAERAQRRGFSAGSLAGAALATLLVGVAVTWFLKPLPPMPELPAPEPLPTRQVSVDLQIDDRLSARFGTAVRISPDETMLAFMTVSLETRERMLMIRRLDELEAKPLRGTENVTSFCFSPESQWICFGVSFNGKGSLKKISVTGGAAMPVCEAPDCRGASWTEEGWIIFAANNRTGLSRVSASGGAPEPFTTLAEGEVTHRWPQVLPGGKGVLFTSCPNDNNFDEGSIMVQSVATGEPKVLWRGGYHGRYLASGHLVYISQNTLFAVLFDPDSLTLKGQPVPVLEEVLTSWRGGAHFDASSKGTLVYLKGVMSNEAYELEWVDREGKREPLLAAARYGAYKFSPDGRFLAYALNDGTQWDIWTYEIERKVRTKLTFDSKNDSWPVWSPGGKSIVFSSDRHDGKPNLYYRAADGSGEVKRLTESPNEQIPFSWHPDGKHLAIAEVTSTDGFDSRVIPMEGNDETGWSAGEARDFVTTEFDEWCPAFSPDGRWLAYNSNETGKFQVYVREFPVGGSRRQVSIDVLGAGYPVWSVTGSELLFVCQLPGNERFQWPVAVAKYQGRGQTILTETPKLWPGGTQTASAPLGLDLHPDGQRLLVRKAVEDEATKGQRGDPVILFENFFEVLRQKMPSGKDAKP